MQCWLNVFSDRSFEMIIKTGNSDVIDWQGAEFNDDFMVQCLERNAMKVLEKEAMGEILAEREKRYGYFRGHAGISQGMKRVMMNATGWPRMSDDKREALEMILHKIARIVNGDPEYIDSWKDIAGFATLVVRNLEKARMENRDDKRK